MAIPRSTPPALSVSRTRRSAMSAGGRKKGGADPVSRASSRSSVIDALGRMPDSVIRSELVSPRVLVAKRAPLRPGSYSRSWVVGFTKSAPVMPSRTAPFTRSCPRQWRQPRGASPGWSGVASEKNESSHSSRSAGRPRPVP